MMHHKAQVVGFWIFHEELPAILPITVNFSFEAVVILDALQKHVAASGNKASHTQKVYSRNLWQLLLLVLWQHSCKGWMCPKINMTW